eukprot:2527043-Rhodomonas_salina.2
MGKGSEEDGRGMGSEEDQGLVPSTLEALGPRAPSSNSARSAALTAIRTCAFDATAMTKMARGSARPSERGSRSYRHVSHHPRTHPEGEGSAYLSTKHGTKHEH